MKFFLPSQPRSHHNVPVHLLRELNKTGRASASRFLAACPAHRATPLHQLPSLASRLRIGALNVKDESHRLGLGSFKALGGAYAVMSLVLDRASQSLGRELRPSDLTLPDVRNVAASMTVACATDGNHGRSVAAGARICGCKAEVFIHEQVSQSRSNAIVRYGAHIVRVEGGYDDAVRAAAKAAYEHNWQIISDTAYEGYEDIPLTVMQGYTVMAGEAFDSLKTSREAAPTHIFLQAGVGGMAAAVSAHALAEYGVVQLPKIVVVEPMRAACLTASARAGKVVSVPAEQATLMAMLECHTPSTIAWKILQPLTSAYVCLEEDEALIGLKHLADAGISAGESGAAGYAGLVACLSNAEARTALDLNVQSRVLVFNTEGATDPQIYADLLQRARRIAPTNY